MISCFLGPPLPTFGIPNDLIGHQMVRVGFDLVVIGGENYGIWEYSESIYKLRCSNKICQWEELSQRLNISREYFVALSLPDDFLDCNT